MTVNSLNKLSPKTYTMIVSHKHKFIFFKTNKTAGTSIEIALSKFCGEDDIIPPLIAEDDAKRKELGYPGPQNYIVPFANYDLKQWWRFLGNPKRAVFRSHMYAHQAKRFLPSKVWQDYYKFGFERNPWDRAVSLYYWIYKEAPRPEFSDFLKSKEIYRLRRKGQGLYSIDGKTVVDRLYKFENLNEAMEDIAEILNLPEVPALPHAKGQTRKNKVSYRHMYSDADIKLIGEIFKNEIEAMGYEF
jgi:hypothetical protein